MGEYEYIRISLHVVPAPQVALLIAGLLAGILLTIWMIREIK
jgi:hypothetical protein